MVSKIFFLVMFVSSVGFAYVMRSLLLRNRVLKDSFRVLQDEILRAPSLWALFSLEGKIEDYRKMSVSLRGNSEYISTLYWTLNQKRRYLKTLENFMDNYKKEVEPENLELADKFHSVILAVEKSKSNGMLTSEEAAYFLKQVMFTHLNNALEDV